jgi:hypothetical protein
MARGALLVVAVGGLGLLLGAAIAGRPQDVPNDVVVTRVPDVTTTTTTITEATRETDATTAPSRSSTTSTTERAGRSVTGGTTTSSLRTTSTSTSTVPATTLAPEAGLRLVVANATDAPGLAARTVALLRAMGYADSVPTDAVTTRPDTIVVHVDGRWGEATRLAAQLGLAPTQVLPRPAEPLTIVDDDEGDADLWVLLGADRT